jgi:hypothetical protein
MIKLEKTEVFGWDAAIRGLRNPMNSWEKSDSYWTHVEDHETHETAKYEFFVGENDLKLMQSLAKAGNDHAKFLRMINVTVDITAPLYWWKEFDTYKVGTVANSCSTMHKIHSEPITVDDFSFDREEDNLTVYVDEYGDNVDIDDLVVFMCEELRQKYVKTGDKKYWRHLIQLLPSSYNQKRTVQLNYAVLKNIYFSRRDHKLDEWHTLCDWIETLPYFSEICLEK